MLDETDLWYYDKKQLVDLTPLEAKLLSILIENKDETITFEEIVLKMFENKSDVKIYKNSIRMTVSRLNKKIGFSLKIKSKRNIGYYIERN